MPERETKFSVNAQPAEVWAFIRDMQSLCACIPGVERVSLVDDRTAELTVREKIGVVPLIVDLTARIDSEEAPRWLHATATAQHLTMEIDVALQASPLGTEMVGRFKVTGVGQFRAVVDRLFEKRADERAAQFATSLEQRFGSVAPAEASERARAGLQPAEGGSGSARRWLSRVWQRVLRLFAPASE